MQMLKNIKYNKYIYNYIAIYVYSDQTAGPVAEN